jgi:hypothetical protein
VRAELAAQVEALLGPKTEADLAPPEKKKKPKVGFITLDFTAGYVVVVHLLVPVVRAELAV